MRLLALVVPLLLLVLIVSCARPAAPAAAPVISIRPAGNATCENGFIDDSGMCHSCPASTRMGADLECHRICSGFFCDGKPSGEQTCNGQRCLPGAYCLQGKCVGCGVGESLYDDGQCR